jgi:hypothetical protein
MSETTSASDGGGKGIGLPPFVASAAADATADLPRRATDAVVGLVDLVHDKAVRPIVLIARGVVYGILIAVLLLVVLVCVCIGFLRLLDVYAFGHRVWLSYLVVGATFSAGGLWFMAKAAVRGRAASS